MRKSIASSYVTHACSYNFHMNDILFHEIITEAQVHYKYLSDLDTGSSSSHLVDEELLISKFSPDIVNLSRLLGD